MTRRLGLLAVGLLLAGTPGCGEEIVFPATGTIYGELHFEDDFPALGIEVRVEGTDLRAFAGFRGEFVINGVVAVDGNGIGKSYVIGVWGYRGGVPVGFLVDEFVVVDKASYSIGRVVVPPTGGIFGYVKLSGTGDYSGVRLTLEGTSLETVSRWDGSFLLDRVPAHQGYRVVYTRPGYRETVVDTMPGTTGPIPVTVTPGETTSLDAVVMERLP